MTLAQRNILVYSPLPHTSKELCDAMRRQSWIKASAKDSQCNWVGRGLSLRVERVTSLESVMDRLYSGYFNLVAVDVRNIKHEDADPAWQLRALDNFFSALAALRDRERRYPRGRIIVLVGDDEEERVDQLIFSLGQRGVGACFRDLSISAKRVGTKVADQETKFIEQFWGFAHDTLVNSRSGKKAINLAGGGITGIYYELGVLKCLNDAMGDMRDLDMYLGVSAGAVVAGCLANNMHINEMVAKIGSLDKTWTYKLALGLRHVNINQVPRRLFLVQREMLKYAKRMLKREDEFSVASMIGTWAAIFGPIFGNTEFEKAIRNLFAKEGRTNDFRKLKRTLLVGATDQDRREHVLFGADNSPEVPISRAIQASTAMHPFFPSVEIEGRQYTDGIVTRTSNLRESINRGADLVFVIDPFIPLITDRPGYNARHGNMWVIEQDYKTLAFTRFSQARDEIVRANPQVNIYTFVPSNRMRQLMSNQNPFQARNFNPIVCEAYRSTFRRLRTLEYKISGELESHDFKLDLSGVEQKVKALRAAKRADVRILLDGEISETDTSVA